MAFQVFKYCKVDKMHQMKLLKLMYFCERQLYLSHNKFITHDSFVSMKHGPVMSNTLKLFRDECPNSSYWDTYFKNDSDENYKTYNIYLIKDKDIGNEKDLLSKKEKRIIKDCCYIFKDSNVDDIIKTSHIICGEWTNPGNKKVIPIKIEDIKNFSHKKNRKK